MHLWQRSPALHYALGLFVLGVIFVIILYIKVAYNAAQDFTLGEESYIHSQYKVAITHYGRTIKWYTPWSNVARLAVGRLWQLGTEAEARGDETLALEAYQTLRSSLYAVQSFYLPYQGWILKSEERIAPLLSKSKVGDDPDADKLAHNTARFAQQLQRHVGPHLSWSILTEIGFLGWVGATIGLIWYVVDEKGNFARRQGLLWGSLLTVFFALWLIGMRLT